MDNKKYKINWIEKKTSQKTGKDYWVMTLVDLETQKETSNVSTFEGSYQPAQEIEGKIVQNGNFLNWKAKLEAPEFIKKAPSSYMMDKKKEAINEAIDKKSSNIKEAQDRSAWMWAKTNASTLLSQHPLIKELALDEVAEQVQILATKIYNCEPIAPFN